MVFGKDLDKVIRCLGNEFNVMYFGWDETKQCNSERKQKLDNDVNVVYIKHDGKMMTLKRYRMADNSMKVELIIEGKVIKCKTKKDTINTMLDYAIHHMGYMDKTLLSVFC